MSCAAPSSSSSPLAVASTVGTSSAPARTPAAPASGGTATIRITSTPGSLAHVDDTGNSEAMQAPSHSQAFNRRRVVPRLRRAAARALDRAAPSSATRAALVATVAVVLVSACSVRRSPIVEHATPASAAGVDSGQGGDSSAARALELATLAKRTHDAGGPLELASDAGTPRNEVVDGGGALPPVVASTDAGELVDAGDRDAGQHDGGGAPVDAARG